jgi:hypothetical protein
MAESKGSSVLAALTAEVMAEKKSEARKLTPVEGEMAPAVLPKTTESFPNDFPQEVIEQKVGELTRIIDHLTDARDAIARLVEAPIPEKVVDLKAEQKKREADADFNADFKAKQEAAQTAVFEPADVDVTRTIVNGETVVKEYDQTERNTDFGWVCPMHGKAVIKTSQKTGRTFVGCPDCNLFKR